MVYRQRTLLGGEVETDVKEWFRLYEDGSVEYWTKERGRFPRMHRRLTREEMAKVKYGSGVLRMMVDVYFLYWWRFKPTGYSRRRRMWYMDIPWSKAVMVSKKVERVWVEEAKRRMRGLFGGR